MRESPHSQSFKFGIKIDLSGDVRVYFRNLTDTYDLFQINKDTDFVKDFHHYHRYDPFFMYNLICKQLYIGH